MSLTVNDFFPAADSGEWKFRERNADDVQVFAFRAHASGNRRDVELDAPPSQRVKSFFDRMTITSAGLELTRIRFTNALIAIQPPFLITLGPETNKTDSLFPPDLGNVPVQAPFDGVITAKHVEQSSGPGHPAHWELTLVSRGRGGDILMRAAFRFEGGLGLVHYSGDFYGNFFIYERLPD